jgi:hypothetical protein
MSDIYCTHISRSQIVRTRLLVWIASPSMLAICIFFTRTHSNVLQFMGKCFCL